MDDQQVRADEREIIFDLTLEDHRVIMAKLGEIEDALRDPEEISPAQRVTFRKNIQCVDVKMRRMRDKINYGDSEIDWCRNDPNQDC